MLHARISNYNTVTYEHHSSAEVGTGPTNLNLVFLMRLPDRVVYVAWIRRLFIREIGFSKMESAHQSDGRLFQSALQ
jgi:hypothetical protein